MNEFVARKGLIVQSISGSSSDSILVESSGLIQKRSLGSIITGSAFVSGSGVADQITFWKSTNQISGSSDFVRLSSGNVGIGTTAPYYKLDVAGDIRIQGANKLYFGGTGSGDGDVNLYRDASHSLYTDDAFGCGGALATSSSLYVTTISTFAGAVRFQGNINFLNKAETAYITFATRNTAGSEAVYNLTNVGNITSTYSAFYISSDVGPIYNRALTLHYWNTYSGGWNNRMQLANNGTLIPGANGTQDFGSTSYRWNNIYGTVGNFNVATGTAPLTVASTTLVSNLNADMLDGQHGSYYQVAGNYLLDTTDTFTGILTIEGNTGNAQLKINDIANRNAAIIFQSAGVSKWFIGRGDTDALTDSSFFIGNADSSGTNAKLVIDTAGSVGIGTTSPQYKLHISGESTNSGSLNIDDVLYVSGSNVGIGTTRPNDILHLFRTTSSGLTVQISGADTNALISTQNDAKTWSFGIRGDVTDSFIIREAGVADRFVINNGGNVGIATTTPYYKLDVAGDIRVQGANKLYFGGTGSGDYLTGLMGTTNATLPIANGTQDFGSTSYRWNNIYGKFIDINAGASAVLAENIRFGRGDGNRYNSIYSYSNSGGTSYLDFRVHDGVTGTSQIIPLILQGDGQILPGVTNYFNLGNETYAWSRVTAQAFTSTVATGTAPLTVASTTLVSNLNADLLDGLHYTQLSILSTLDGATNPNNPGVVATPSRTSNPAPNAYAYSTSLEFKTAGNLSIPEYTYWAGVLSIAPYNGVTASTGGGNYQLSFSANDATAIPYLYLRTGIDTTWGSWYKLYHSGNLTNPVTGTGTAGYIPKWNTGGTSLGNSMVSESSGDLLVTAGSVHGIKITSSADSPIIDLWQLAKNNAGATNWRILTNWEAWGNLDFKVSADNNSAPSATKMSLKATGELSITNAITATTAKLTNLTDNYIPKHTSDAVGLENSIIYTTGTDVTTFSTYKGANSDGYNLFIGRGGQNSIGEVGATHKGSYNTANGPYSLYYNTTGTNNTANGFQSLYSNTTGYQNTANGVSSLQNNTTGYYNTANGFQSLYSNTTGYQNTANGVYSLYYNTTGTHNLSEGYYSGIGAENAAEKSVEDTYMTFLGDYASKQNVATLTNGTALGYNAKVLQSNQVVLGNSSVTSVKTYGVITAPTIACSNLTDGYLPYHISDASGLGNSPVYTDGTNVGVGTTAPQTIFNTFSTNARGLAIANTYPFMSLSDNDGGNFHVGTQANLAYLWNGGTSDMIFATNNAEKMRILSSGSVGIGTTAPGAKLHVSGTGNSAVNTFWVSNDQASTSPYLIVNTGHSTNDYQATSITENPNYIMSVGTKVAGGVYKSLITAGQTVLASITGNVGIGTTTPPEKLTITGNISGSGTIKIDTIASSTSDSVLVETSGLIQKRSLGSIISGSGFVSGSGIDNQVAVWNSINQIEGDSNFTWDGSTLSISGRLEADAKSFVINHPSRPGYKLVHGNIEGPEFGIYLRGKLNGNNIIELPDYWEKMVDEESITVSLTPFGSYQDLYVEKIESNKIYIKKKSLMNSSKVSCYYVIYGERKDIEPLVVERKIV